MIDEMCPSPVARRLRMNRRDPCGQARLVGMPDHRRIEQGRRFQSVFLGEVGADQQPPVLADRQVGQQVAPDLIEAVQKEFAGPLVSFAKLPHHLLQQVFDFPLGKGRDARDDPLDSDLAGISNGRMTTRELDGLRMIPVRLTSMLGTSDLATNGCSSSPEDEDTTTPAAMPP